MFVPIHKGLAFALAAIEIVSIFLLFCFHQPILVIVLVVLAFTICLGILFRCDNNLSFRQIPVGGRIALICCLIALLGGVSLFSFHDVSPFIPVLIVISSLSTIIIVVLSSKSSKI